MCIKKLYLELFLHFRHFRTLAMARIKTNKKDLATLSINASRSRNVADWKIIKKRVKNKRVKLYKVSISVTNDI